MPGGSLGATGEAGHSVERRLSFRLNTLSRTRRAGASRPCLSRRGSEASSFTRSNRGSSRKRQELSDGLQHLPIAQGRAQWHFPTAAGLDGSAAVATPETDPVISPVPAKRMGLLESSNNTTRTLSVRAIVPPDAFLKRLVPPVI